MLWIAHADAASLPDDVLELRRHGLTIEFCDDLKSFRKIVPALASRPDAFIAIADDVYYEPDWLERLVAAFDPENPTVVCNRAHRIRHDDGAGCCPTTPGRRTSGTNARPPLAAT